MLTPSLPLPPPRDPLSAIAICHLHAVTLWGNMMFNYPLRSVFQSESTPDLAIYRGPCYDARSPPTPHTSYRCRCCPCPLVRRRSHPHHHYHHYALPRPPAITTTNTNIATTSSTDALTTFHQRPKPCELQFRTQRTCMIRAAGVTAALRPQSDEF